MQGVWPSQLEVFRGNGHAAWTLGLCVQVAPSTLSVYRASAGAGAALRAHVRDQAFGARRPHSQKGLEWTVMQRKTGTELPASSQDFSGLSQMSLKNITHTGVPCQPGGVGWGGRWEGGSKGPQCHAGNQGELVTIHPAILQGSMGDRRARGKPRGSEDNTSWAISSFLWEILKWPFLSGHEWSIENSSGQPSDPRIFLQNPFNFLRGC